MVRSALRGTICCNKNDNVIMPKVHDEHTATYFNPCVAQASPGRVSPCWGFYHTPVAVQSSEFRVLALKV